MIEGSALFLIASVLVSGGLLAVLGDYLGSKIGKARLRLFNLRPRQTAQVVTILTGTFIAASTLAINFALSKPLRQGVFELQSILKQLRTATADLNKVAAEKQQVEKHLTAAKQEQEAVGKRLLKINRNFTQARAKLKAASSQAERLRSDIKILLADRQKLLEQKSQLDQQISTLRQQVGIRDQQLKKQLGKIASQDRILQQRQVRLQQLETQQRQLQTRIDKRDREIANLDREIAAKDSDLTRREKQLKDLESQLSFLKQQVEVLEQYYQTYQELRERQIALVKGQVLAFAALRVVDPQSVKVAIDRLLAQANRMAIEATRPGENVPEERVVQITQSQVDQLSKQLQDRREYVVRILSAGNYVQGEKEVRVFADIALNQQVFQEGETIATVSLDSSRQTEAEIQKRLDSLLAATQFRARRAGILGAIQIEEGRTKTLLDFLGKLNASEDGFDEIKAVASDNTYTAGPLKVRLLVLQNGEVVFGT
jgi:uncharacterized protein (DUF3084 family)